MQVLTNETAAASKQQQQQSLTISGTGSTSSTCSASDSTKPDDCDDDGMTLLDDDGHCAVPTAVSSQSPGTTATAVTPSSSSTVSDERDRLHQQQEEERIQVSIRMRPLNRMEEQQRHLHACVWKVLPQYSSITQTTRHGECLAREAAIAGRTYFSFDKTFTEQQTTEQVYRATACQDIVASVVSTGRNGVIFAYGQTSSGKTYTMQGPDIIGAQQKAALQGATRSSSSNNSISNSVSLSSDDGGSPSSSKNNTGIVQLAAQDIFEHIQSTPHRTFTVKTSFVEIYNEEVRDLLSPPKAVVALQIREDPVKGVFLPNCCEQTVQNYADLVKVLQRGEKSRKVAATDMNERSSRSHTIFRISITSQQAAAASVKKSSSTQQSSDDDNDDSNDDDDDDSNSNSENDGPVLSATLNLVDLAGSESVRHTGVTGDRQKEGGMINQSLLTLSRVITALGTPNVWHVNFRDSKLTRLLQPSLSGNARMAIICCATPSELYLEETRSTLAFASRAKLVKTSAKVNEILQESSDHVALIAKLKRELARAQRQALERNAGSNNSDTDLERKLEAAQAEAKEAQDRLHRLQASVLNGGILFGKSSSQRYHDTHYQHHEHHYEEDTICSSSHGALVTPIKPSSSSSSSSVSSPRSPGQHRAPHTVGRSSEQHSSSSSSSSPSSSELAILRQAIVAKSTSLNDLQKQLDEISQRVKAKEAELRATSAERDGAKQESSLLATELSTLREQLEKASAAQQTLRDEKESAVQDVLANIEQELAERRQAEDALQAIQEEKTHWENEKSSLWTQIQSLQDEKDEATVWAENLEQEAIQTHEECAAQLLDAQQAIGALQDELTAVQADRDALREKVDELSRKGSNDNKKLEQQRKRQQETIDSLRATLESNRAELLSMKKERDALGGNNKKLEQQRKQQKEKIDSLRAALESNRSELLSTKKERYAVGGNNKKLEQQQKQQQETIDSLGAALESNQAELLSTKKERDALSSKLKETVQSAAKERATSDIKAKKTTDELTAVQVDRDSLREKVDQLSGNVSKQEKVEQQQKHLQETIDSLRVTLESNQAQLLSTKNECDALSSELKAKIQSASDERTTDAANAKEAIDELQSALDTAQTGFASATAARDKISAQLQDAVQQLDEERATVERLNQTISDLTRIQVLSDNSESSDSSTVEQQQPIVDSSGQELIPPCYRSMYPPPSTITVSQLDLTQTNTATRFLLYGPMAFALEGAGKEDLSAFIELFKRCFKMPERVDIICPRGCGQKFVSMPLLVSHLECRHYEKEGQCPSEPTLQSTQITPAFVVSVKILPFLKSLWAAIHRKDITGPLDILDPLAIPLPIGEAGQHKDDSIVKELALELETLHRRHDDNGDLSSSSKPSMIDWWKEKLRYVKKNRDADTTKAYPHILTMSFLQPPSLWPDDLKRLVEYEG